MTHSRASIDRRFVIRGIGGVSACALGGYLGQPGAARAAAVDLGIAGFPGPSISSHSKAVIKGLRLDEQEGWTLRWETRPTSDSYYNDFVSGAYESIDFGGLNVFANLSNKGVPLKVVQATVHWPTPIVVRADSGIQKLADLAGKSFGIDRSSFAYAYVTAAAKAAGLKFERDIKVENVGFFQAPPRFQRGDFDGAVMLFEHAIDMLNKVPGRYRILMDSSDAFAKAIGIRRAYQFQAVRDDWLSKNPGGINRVIATYDLLGRAFKDRQQEVISILAKPKEQLGASLDPKIAEVEYVTGTAEGLRTEWLSRPVASLGDDLKKELEAYRELGLIERMPDDKLLLRTV